MNAKILYAGKYSGRKSVTGHFHREWNWSIPSPDIVPTGLRQELWMFIPEK